MNGIYYATVELRGEELEVSYTSDRWDGIVLQEVLVGEEWVSADYPMWIEDMLIDQIKEQLADEARREYA